tara:strand:+ start:2895 stop:3242 length:348 start_codon:yes stop_codon:yes gene_type:complete
MSDSLKGKIEFNEKPDDDKQSLMACFIFEDEEYFKEVIQVTFEKSKKFSKNNLKNIVIDVKKDLGLLKKLVSDKRMLSINLPYLEYSCKIDQPITYLLNEANNYSRTLSISVGEF